MDPRARRPAFARATSRGMLLLLLALAAGCAASHPKPSPGVIAGPKPRVALIPLENLTLHEDASEMMTRVLFVELVKRGACEMIEAGEVEAVMESLRVRPTSSLSAEERAEFARRLGAAYLMVGSVLESDVSHTPDGDVPALAVALKLIDAANGRVAWADLGVRTGDDRERIFGWGRERSRERLAAVMAEEILQGLEFPAAATAPAPAGALPPDSARTGAPR